MLPNRLDVIAPADAASLLAHDRALRAERQRVAQTLRRGRARLRETRARAHAQAWRAAEHDAAQRLAQRLVSFDADLAAWRAALGKVFADALMVLVRGPAAEAWVAAAVQRAQQHLGELSFARLEVAADDVAAARAALAPLAQAASVQMSVDPSLAPGACAITTTHGRIEIDAAAMIECLRDQLMARWAPAPAAPDAAARGVRVMSSATATAGLTSSGGAVAGQSDTQPRQVRFDAAAVEDRIQRVGLVREAYGTLLRASGLRASVGDLCELQAPDGTRLAQAEVVGLHDGAAVLLPFGPLHGLSAGTRVLTSGRMLSLPASDALLGRVIDAFGVPVDDRGPVGATVPVALMRTPPAPLRRQLIREALPCGVKVVDALATLGVGQRIGVFAPAGVGKSTLLGMMARNARADVVVIGLIGERGREVREFIEVTLGAAGLAHACVVVATSDAPAAERLRAAYAATALAEYFRDQGRRVLLMIDSLTRFARAQREIGLASGEPPTRQGFPPSTFAVLPQLLERAGPAERGSISAVYTILTDEDESNDPIAEEVRSIVDGHLVLSRRLAERGQYPAVDPLASLSRLMGAVASRPHQQAAARVRALIAKYREIELLVQLGEFKRGGDPLADAAVDAHAAVDALLAQALDEYAPFEATLAQLAQIAAMAPESC